MEKMLMSAGLVVAFVLGVVGLLKLPCKRFKEKHPHAYRATFTMVSIFLALGMAVVDEIYVLGGSLLSFDFVLLVLAVIAGVTGLYTSYEGLGAKVLVNKIVQSIKQAREIAKDKKFINGLKRIEDIDKAITILVERKNSQNHEV